MIYYLLPIQGMANSTDFRVLTVEVRGFGVTGQDQNVGSETGVEVMQPFGLYSRPEATDTLDAMVFRDGDETVVAFMRDKQRTHPALDPGDAQLENHQVTAWARVAGDGTVTLRSKDGTSTVTMSPTGEVTVTAPTDKNIVANAGHVWLGKAAGALTTPPTDGVVLGRGVDPFTGQTYAALGSASAVVRAAG